MKALHLRHRLRIPTFITIEQYRRVWRQQGAAALDAMRALGCGLVLALAAAGPAHAQDAAPQALPSFAEMEAAGARIGEIHIRAQDIFDTTDPKEDKLLFRWANKLHIQTRPGVIERALLFRSGDLLSVQRLEETERLLLSNRFLYDVKLRATRYQDGVVDIEVITRDTWSLDPGLSVSRSGGANSSGIQLKEYNLLGTGVALSLGRSTSVDRTSNEFQFSNDRLFGTWTSMFYSHSSNSDGRRDAGAVVRPFYALDTRWAAGVSALQSDRIESIYRAGTVASQYRHLEKRAEVFGGWSNGLVDGWVQRYSLGATLQDDRFEVQSGLQAPAQLPQDERLTAPFARYSIIENRFESERNRNLIGRPEFFALGWNATVQLGRSSTALGASRDAWLYSGSLSRGFEPTAVDTLMVAARLSGHYADGQVRHQLLGAQAQYYRPQGKRWLLYAAALGEMLSGADPGEALLLGGDNGLRGYPLRYQSGTRRALFTVEERFYTDVYAWRLFRLGGAAFLDTGRAWGGGDNFGANTANPGWLSNVGFGLRIVSARAAFSNVLHVDLALPLNTTADMKKLQFLVKTKTSF